MSSIYLHKSDSRLHVQRATRFVVRIGREAIADLIVLDNEILETNKPLELFDPIHTYKRKCIQNYEVDPMLIPIIIGGELVYNIPKLPEIRQRVEKGLKQFSSEILRHVKPHGYHVDLSQKLWDLKQDLLHQWRPSK